MTEATASEALKAEVSFGSLVDKLVAPQSRAEADILDRVRAAIGKDDVEAWNALLSAASHLRLDAWRREERSPANLPPTPDAGEVRTYREGVEDAARVADELANVPAVGHSPDEKFHNRIERTMARTIAAAIRKLP